MGEGTAKKALMFEQIRVKRKDGYAAAERRITHRYTLGKYVYGNRELSVLEWKIMDSLQGS